MNWLKFGNYLIVFLVLGDWLLVELGCWLLFVRLVDVWAFVCRCWLFGCLRFGCLLVGDWLADCLSGWLVIVWIVGCWLMDCVVFGICLLVVLCLLLFVRLLVVVWLFGSQIWFDWCLGCWALIVGWMMWRSLCVVWWSLSFVGQLLCWSLFGGRFGIWLVGWIIVSWLCCWVVISCWLIDSLSFGCVVWSIM